MTRNVSIQFDESNIYQLPINLITNHSRNQLNSSQSGPVSFPNGHSQKLHSSLRLPQEGLANG